MFFNYVKTKNKKLYDNLNQGLSDNEITKLCENLGFSLPEEIRYLYNLKNGFKTNIKLPIDQCLMFEDGLFLSLQKGTEEYELLKYENNMAYKLPIFESGFGDFLLVDDDVQSKTYKQILIWSPSLLIVDPITIYDSLVQLMMTTIRSFVIKAYYYDKHYALQVDDEKFHEVARDCNCQSLYWDWIAEKNK